MRLQMVVLAAIVAAFTYATAGRKTLINDSNHAVRHVYVSRAGDSHWSSDQLAGTPLPRGESVALTNVRCRSDYFVKVVNETGQSYVLKLTSSCDEDAEWRISENDLLVASQPVQITRAATRSGRESGSR